MTDVSDLGDIVTGLLVVIMVGLLGAYMVLQ